MPKKSKEYDLLKKNRGDVEKAIQMDLKWIAEKLNDPGFEVLTDPEYNEVTNVKSLQSEEDKAGQVCKRLLQRVDLNPDALRVFVEILEEKEVKFKSVILKLRGGLARPVQHEQMAAVASGQPTLQPFQPQAASLGQPMDQPQAGYPEAGYPVPRQPTGQPQVGYPAPGQPMGQPQAGYPQARYPVPGQPTGQPQVGYPQPTGQPQVGYPQAGYPQPMGQPYTALGQPMGQSHQRYLAAEQFVAQRNVAARGYFPPDMTNPHLHALPSQPRAGFQPPRHDEAIPRAGHINVGGFNLEMVDGSELDRDDDVAEVVESVQRLTSTWPKLGLYLHLREDSIKTIEKNNPRDAQQCLHDAIVEWLKQNYNFHKFGSPSWRVLVYAVKKLDAALAYEIAGNHIISAGMGQMGYSNPPQQVVPTQNPFQLQYPILKTAVTLPKLNIIKWKDKSGNAQRLRLLDEMSVKWKTWGETVDISGSRLDGIDRENMSRNRDCMGAAVRDWMQMDSEEYPATWEGLLKLLDDIDMKSLVRQILEIAADDPNSLK